MSEPVMGLGLLPGGLGAVPLYGEQVVKLHIGEGFQDLRPRAAREPVAVTPEADGARLISGGLGYGSVAAFGVDEAGSVFEHEENLTRRKIEAQAPTSRHVTFPAVISRLMDTSWTGLEHSYERLRWARMQAGFASMRDAAEALGEREGTYRQYEAEPGSTSRSADLKHQLAIKAGRKFRVSWTWLLTGEGTPFDKPSNAHQQRAIQAMATVPEEKQAALAEAIEALVKSAA